MPYELLRQSNDYDEGQAEEMAAVLVDAPAGIAVTSLAGSLLYANKAFLSCFELPDLESSRLNHISQLTRGVLTETFLLQTVRSSAHRHARLTWPGREGTRELVCAAVRLVRLAVPAYIAFVVQDITLLVADHRKQLRSALDLLGAQRLAGACIWIMAVDAGNLAASSITWAPGADVVFAPSAAPSTFGAFLEHIEPLHRECLHASIKTAIAQTADEATGEYSIDYTLMANGDAPRRMRSAGRVVKDPVDGQLRLHAIELDLSMHRHEGASLARSAPLIDRLDVPVAWIDRRFRYQYFNRAFVAFLNANKSRPPQVGDLVLSSIDDPQRRRLVVDTFARVMRGEELVYEREIVDEQGRVTQWIDFHYMPVRLASGAVDGAIVVGRDVTPLKRANLRYEHLNEELTRSVDRRTAKIRAVKRDLASRVATTCLDASEELRALRASLYELLVGAGDANASSAVMAYIERIESKLDKLTQLTNTSVRKPEQRNIDMNRLVQQVCHELTAALYGRAIAFDNDRLPMVVSDSVLVRQILVNLLANAIEATRDTPTARIRVWAVEDGGCVVWSIADNGIGFEMKDADGMFSSFACRGARAPGMGLGIAWHAVQQLGGRIWCEGQPGKGAVFHFTLGKGGEGR